MGSWFFRCRLPRLALPLMFVLLFVGCAGLDAQYVRADVNTHAAVASEYQRYVQNDVGLTDEQRARRLRTLDAWARRLHEASLALGIGSGERP